ncbi:MAG TPA: O-antigen ligase family protein [Bryobacteraceae bacterium]|nr:O-antigen ligase family protein [Bryobacteraceae bacterium]
MSEIAIASPAVARPASYPAARMERPLEGNYVWLLSALFFFLAATNGRPFWWSSLAPALAISGLLILRRSPREVGRAAFNKNYRAFTIPLLIIMVCSVISAVVSSDPLATIEVLLRCVVPLLIYFSLVGSTLRAQDFWKLAVGLAAGATFMFARGIAAFYSEFGIPDMSTLLWARYDIFRITGYMDATLGNVSHMGLYVALVLPPLIFGLISFRLGRSIMLLSWMALITGLLNLVISGSRTAIVVVVLATAPIFIRRGFRSIIIFGLFITVLLVAVIYQGLDPVSEGDLIQRFLPSETSAGVDASAQERYLSVVHGWQAFKDHPFFGVGPGLSFHYNPYHFPHESLVHVLSEIGLVGGVTFLIFNLVVLFRTGATVVKRSPTGAQHWRLYWLLGPACWCAFGIAGGTGFTMSVALLWAGMVHAMLALAYANVVDVPAYRPSPA